MSPEKTVLKKDQAEDERELLRLLLEKEGLGAQDWEIKSPADHERLPLSWPQKRLWFLDRLQPGSAFYNVVVVCELHGDLNVPALERSLAEIIRRHGALRTRIVVEDGEPVQKVEESIEFRLQLFDLTNQEPTEDRRKQMQKIAIQDSAEPFDLGSAPLLRAMLVRLGAREHILQLSIHHIVMDEWSMGVLQQEMTLLYEAYVQGKESPLQEMPLQYVEYTLWQAQWLQGEVFARQMEYWKEKLAGMPEVLELSTDKPRPAIPQHRGSVEAVAISGDYWQKMKWFSRQEGFTDFMTVLAIYQVLLLRYTGQTDFGVGTPITNRNHVRMEGMIGFCVNTLIMRADLRGAPTFREVVGRVKKATLEAFDHQDLPLEKLVEELSPERQITGSPLFQVTFTFMSGAGLPREFPGIKVRPLRPEITTSKYDLALLVQDDEIPKLAFNYDTELFEADTIQRMLHHFGYLLASAVDGPDQRIWDLAMLTEDENRQLLVEWNAKDIQSTQKCVHELFEEQVRRPPNAPAIVFEGASLTYGDLNRKANQLAHYLRSLGVKPETRVAIGVERGLEMVVGMVAVLKAGGAYVPLDLSYPEQRLQFMLQDSAPVALLVRSDLQGMPGAMEAGIQMVDLGNEVVYEELPETNLDRAETGVNPESLAYVIYTSGSTGEPKGSEIPHRSIPGFIFGTDYVGFDEETVLLQHSSVSWDAFTLELWGALLRGGRSVLAREQRVTSGEEIREYVQGRGVNTLWLTAALFNVIVESDVKSLEGLKYVMTGGEAASVAHIRRALEQLPGLQLVHAYGPSECTVFSSCYVVPGKLPERLVSLPIGKPIGDRRTYVLDRWMNVVPVGVVGEGFIGGASVARGYMGRAEMTAERFVPDPYSAKGGERLYRTGDLLRWRKDGAIEFVGRNDFQVKVRGFRIELGEIEAVLQQQSGVQGCAVVAKTAVNGSKRLVAYVVGERNLEELRRNLKGKLPAYMLPNAIVGLQALPLTSNGKLDRQALEKLEDLDSGDSGEYYEAPCTAVEEQLAEIWCAVLEVTRVGRHSNFFDLGGHSLLAIAMESRCRNVFGVDVPVRVIFESPTLAELAEVIELELKSQGRTTRDGKSAKSTQRSSALRPSVFPLSYQQEQLWFLDQFQPGSDFYNVPLAWKLIGDLDVPTLERALREMVRRHEQLRTCFVMDQKEGLRQKVVGESLDVRLPVIDLRHIAAGEREEQARKILEEEGRRPFDLTKLPLWRAVLVQTGEREHVLGLNLHHILCDDWSLRILMSEWGKLYAAYGKGEDSPLPELEMQYGEYAVEQRERLGGGKFQQQMDYWKGQLEGMPQVLELPTDHGRPVRESFRGGTEQRTLSRDLLEGLNDVGKGERASLFMTALAVYQVLLMRYTGQEDFGIGTVVTNRKRAEMEPIFGFFLNTLVIRANLGGEPTFREVLQRVRMAALAGYEHQDVSF